MQPMMSVGGGGADSVAGLLALLGNPDKAKALLTELEAKLTDLREIQSSLDKRIALAGLADEIVDLRAKITDDAKAASDARTLAERNAAAIVTDAQSQASGIVANAKSAAQDVVTAAQNEANKLLDAAKQQALATANAAAELDAQRRALIAAQAEAEAQSKAAAQAQADATAARSTYEAKVVALRGVMGDA